MKSWINFGKDVLFRCFNGLSKKEILLCRDDFGFNFGKYGLIDPKRAKGIGFLNKSKKMKKKLRIFKIIYDFLSAQKYNCIWANNRTVSGRWFVSSIIYLYFFSRKPSNEMGG